MQEIFYATKEDVLELEKVMDEVVVSLLQKDWYVADDIPFLERHIKEEGYILKYVIDDKIVAFLDYSKMYEKLEINYIFGNYFFFHVI